MTERLNAAFRTKQIIPFITANFPNRAIFLDILYRLPACNSQIIEIGIPFSDPMADGPVIQETSQIALSTGFDLNTLLADLGDFRRQFPDIAIIIMTYMNPVHAYGESAFYTTLSQHNIDGLLIVDRETNNVKNQQPDVATIRLIAPNTTVTRLAVINQQASGFLYYVATHSTTGSKEQDPDYTHLKTVIDNTKLPVVIGFGIQSSQLVKKLSPLVSGIVIGSAFLKPLLAIDSNQYDTIINDQLSYLSLLSKEIVQ